MKAAILPAFGQPLSIEEIPRPTVGADEVLIAVEACGVCHSDLHIIDGDTAAFRTAAKQRLVPGHEVVGKVVERGASVTHLRIGERVGVPWIHWACGECDPCREGHENLCRRSVVTGLGVDGGYAELMRAKAAFAVPVPAALSAAQAAPLFCAGITVYRALKNAGVSAGQRVGVFGVGGLGHLAVQMARAWGAEVVGFDLGDEKLAFARELGAAHAIDVRADDAIKQAKALGGLHVAVVTSAAKPAYDMALRCLRPTGTLAVVGLPPEPLTFPALALVGSEARIVAAAIGTRDDVRAVLALAAEGKVACRIEEVPLAGVNEVLDRMRRGAIRGRIVLRCC